MLLSWDANDIYLDKFSSATLTGAKNLVLELTYSIVHRIQELIKLLCDRVVRSIGRRDNRHNPIAICCALWIVFAATHKFEKRNFNSRSLTNLVRADCNYIPCTRGVFMNVAHANTEVPATVPETISQYAPRTLPRRDSLHQPVQVAGQRPMLQPSERQPGGIREANLGRQTAQIYS